MCWLENTSLDKRQAMYLKNNYPNPIGPIHSTKEGNDAANGHFNAFAAGGKSDCRKAVPARQGSLILDVVPAGTSCERS